MLPHPLVQGPGTRCWLIGSCGSIHENHPFCDGGSVLVRCVSHVCIEQEGSREPCSGTAFGLLAHGQEGEVQVANPIQDPVQKRLVRHRAAQDCNLLPLVSQGEALEPALPMGIQPAPDANLKIGALHGLGLTVGPDQPVVVVPIPPPSYASRPACIPEPRALPTPPG
jgi:hypothetical protein